MLLHTVGEIFALMRGGENSLQRTHWVNP